MQERERESVRKKERARAGVSVPAAVARTKRDFVLPISIDSVDGLLCVDASLALGLLIFWLIIQIVLIVGCLLAVAQYRRTAIRAEEDRADVLARHLYGIHGGNFEIARRVRWADRDTPSSLA